MDRDNRGSTNIREVQKRSSRVSNRFRIVAVLFILIAILGSSYAELVGDSGTFTHEGICDASGVVDLGGNEFGVADDELNLLLAYEVGESGAARESFEISKFLDVVKPPKKKKEKKKKSKEKKKEKTYDFDALSFLARITPHIPDKWESTTRYYGVYSSRSRGEAPKRAAHSPDSDNITVLPHTDKRSASSTWAALIKKVYETDPLICEKCGSPMKIKAFITDPREAARIANSLGLAFNAPPPITGPPESVAA